ncbi:dual serine/threonine and tyrosine protein kinase-like, partial [Octopus sinensis]|uniref:Dual serine/threonine and tyrosine protein kinase-like n=1 Tax=Octopus sinensis TaxID=2607531 RepID=A0A7E6ELA2_9MOLL
SRELGRGQYGVVYFCEKWGEFESCAVKTLVPPDDRHISDVSLEIYYARLISLTPLTEFYPKTTVWCPCWAQSCTRMTCRLQFTYFIRNTTWIYAMPLKNKCHYKMGIALEVVEGIRFIHGQGHIHRDIKLSNIMVGHFFASFLLDCNFHAKLTDMGFCKPVSMISGTVVGTPIHMSPELLSGKYDRRVDIFAFGILFCSGNCTMPHVYQQYNSVHELWNMVGKGQRPERLSFFDQDWWDLMNDCWNTDPCLRPHIGEKVEQSPHYSPSVQSPYYPQEPTNQP